MATILMTYMYVPSGTSYGLPASNVTVSMTNIANEVIKNGSLADAVVTSGLSIRGVVYSASVDSALVAGPYVTCTWTAYDAGNSVLGTSTKKCPVLPNNYVIKIKFNQAVVSTSGDTMIKKDTENRAITVLDPFLVPVDYFRTVTYGAFTTASDFEVAKLIHHVSKQSVAETFCEIEETDVRYPYLSYIQRLYTIQKALGDYIRYISATEGSVSKKLADLEITVERGGGIGMRVLMTNLNDELKQLRKVLNSCGELSQGTSLKVQVGRIADNYDRSVFGRYIEGIGIPYSGRTLAESLESMNASRLYFSPYYMVPPSRNHLFTDPYSAYWVK